MHGCLHEQNELESFRAELQAQKQTFDAEAKQLTELGKSVQEASVSVQQKFEEAQRQETRAKQLADESRELKEKVFSLKIVCPVRKSCGFHRFYCMKALADRREMESIRDGIQELREQTNRKQLALEEVRLLAGVRNPIVVTTRCIVTPVGCVSG